MYRPDTTLPTGASAEQGYNADRKYKLCPMAMKISFMKHVRWAGNHLSMLPRLQIPYWWMIEIPLCEKQKMNLRWQRRTPPRHCGCFHQKPVLKWIWRIITTQTTMLNTHTQTMVNNSIIGLVYWIYITKVQLYQVCTCMSQKFLVRKTQYSSCRIPCDFDNSRTWSSKKESNLIITKLNFG